MNNVCEIEQIQSKGGQPTFMDILQELNRLRLENTCLKADNQELQISNQILRNDNEILHNKYDIKEDFLNNNEENKPNEYIDFLNSDESIDYNEAYANVSLR